MRESTCAVADCDRPRWRRDMCSPHYQRVRRRGTTKTSRTCKVRGCAGDLRGSQQMCAEHRSQCAKEGCCDPRAGRSAHCKVHKNYRASPLPAPEGMRVCRRCGECRAVDEFYAGHDWCKACHTGYRAANRDRMRAWRDTNAARLLAYRRWYEPRMREVVNARNATIRSRTVPFTIEQLEARFAYYGHRCWICRAPAEHADHVKPINAGGWHMLANLRPACARCNQRKNKSWPITSIDLDRIRAA